MTYLSDVDYLVDEYYNRPLILEAGVRYLRRDGEVVTLNDGLENLGLPFKTDGWYYTPKKRIGSSYSIWPEEEDDYDIVAYARLGVDYEV